MHQYDKPLVLSGVQNCPLTYLLGILSTSSIFFNFLYFKLTNGWAQGAPVVQVGPDGSNLEMYEWR